MYGYICPECGAHLDPGEPCDCRSEKEQKKKKVSEISQMMAVGQDGQMRILFEEAV